MSGRLRVATAIAAWALLIAPPGAFASPSDRLRAQSLDAKPLRAVPDQPRERSAPAGPRTRRAAFVPGEVIVGYRRRTPGADRARVRSAANAALHGRLEVPRAELLRIHGNRSPERVARALERRPEVAYAQPNRYRYATATIPNDPRFPSLWGLRNTGQLARSQAGAATAEISAPQAWDITTGDGEIIVGVADTGIAAGHPDLSANIAPGGWDWVDNDAIPSDPSGHGTHVAGTIGAVGDNGIGVTGVAWDVKLLRERVLGADGVGTDESVANGFAHAAQKGARIVNASLGGEGEAPVIDAAIAAAPQALFVVAAGNESSDNDAEPFFPCNSPNPNVICVAATDNRDALAEFSNFGAGSVHLAAPGVDIDSTAAPNVDRELFFEGFEEPLAERWSPGGTNNTWELDDDEPFSGDHSATDSPGGDYLPGTNAWIDSPVFSVADGAGCELRFSARGDVDPSDGLFVDVSEDGFTQDWVTYGPADVDLGWEQFIADLSPQGFDGAPQLQISFRLFSNGDGAVGQGVHVDHASVVCEGSGHGYDFLSGTSMATPHVSGAAALVLSEFPSATTAQLRDAILSSVDVKPGLAGLVATGGRLNAHQAVNSVPPRARITSGPQGAIRNRQPTFTFSASKAGTFRCSIDGGPFTLCFSPHQLGPLADGIHTFRVRALNEHGAGTAAARSFRIDTTAPVTRFVKRPPRRSRQRVARFRFRANEPATFRCRLNRRPWRACKSPRRYRVKPRRHVFRVRAVDRAGNRGKPRVWSFRVRR